MKYFFLYLLVAVALFAVLIVIGNSFAPSTPEGASIAVTPAPVATSTQALQTVQATTTPAPTPVSSYAEALRTIELDGQTLHVFVADNDQTREQGLGGRTGLAQGEGMLFIFQQDGIYGFWMKDMSFSIDMVWISAQGKVVYLVQNVSPDTYPQDFVPNSVARYVLELPANWTKAYNTEVGDIVRL